VFHWRRHPLRGSCKGTKNSAYNWQSISSCLYEPHGTHEYRDGCKDFSRRESAFSNRFKYWITKYGSSTTVVFGSIQPLKLCHLLIEEFGPAFSPCDSNGNTCTYNEAGNSDDQSHVGFRLIAKFYREGNRVKHQVHLCSAPLHLHVPISNCRQTAINIWFSVTHNSFLLNKDLRAFCGRSLKCDQPSFMRIRTCHIFEYFTLLYFHLSHFCLL
jgi:hypothetical protein